jgi:hypothetical protein
MQITPDIGVPYSVGISYMDLRERAEATCNTAVILGEFGLNLVPTSEDDVIASALITSYASNDQVTSKQVSNTRAAELAPATFLRVNEILSEFGHQVVESSMQIRHLITNKLLIDSDHADPRVRLKAIELLGKIEDVGLFSQKSEVTVTHQSTSDLRETLRSKLHKLVGDDEEIVDAVVIDSPRIEDLPE